ncbi:MAG: C25 family cysteine peptidase [Promethearchaeota archaeon]
MNKNCLKKISRIVLFIMIFISLLSMSNFTRWSEGDKTYSFKQIHQSQDDLIPINESIIFPSNKTWKNPLVKCLIITSDELKDSLEPLAELKTSRGTFTKILTTQEIYANATFTSNGSDGPAYIRNAIKYYHDNFGTEYVILGGDVNIVPTRYTYNPDFPDGETTYYSGFYAYNKPTDHYYANLNGTWDEDGDGIFGEMNIYNEDNQDEVDWDTEVYVGRLPINDVSEANTVVNKIIRYELDPPDGSWYNTAILGGAVSQFSTSGNSAVDEAELSEFIIDHYLNAMNNKRLYYCSNSYTPPSNYTVLTRTALSEAVSNGASLVNLAGHGDPTSFGGRESFGYSRYMTVDSASNLDNNGSFPLIYIYSCSSGAFDIYEVGTTGFINKSLAEALILNPSGGAIAVVSAMRTTYYFDNDTLLQGLNRGQDRYFWREFAINNYYQPGKAFYKSLESYIEMFIDKYWNVDLNHDQELADQYPNEYLPWHEHLRKNILTYNLLGDPEIYIYTNTPKNISDDVISNELYCGDTVVVDVKTTDGCIISRANILLNGSGYYITAQANAFGRAKLQIPRNMSLIGKNITVTISGHNAYRFSKNVTIINDTLPPAMFNAVLQSNDRSSERELVITASGVDAGSGIKYAFIVFLDSNNNVLGIEPMEMTSVAGNSTEFRYEKPIADIPKSANKLYVIGFDASANPVVDNNDGHYFQIELTNNSLTVTLLYIAVIGCPVIFGAVLIWFIYSRKKLKKSTKSSHDEKITKA